MKLKKPFSFLLILVLLLSLPGFYQVNTKAAEVKPSRPKVSVKANGTGIDVTIRKTKNVDDSC